MSSQDMKTKTIKRKSKRQIILETAKAYTCENRSIIKRAKCDGEGRCAYKDRRGNNCAIGRCLIPNSILFKGGNNFDAVDSFSCIDTQFKEEYRGHSLTFWKGVQNLHDRGRYWDEEGINTDGKAWVEFLLKEWKGK